MNEPIDPFGYQPSDPDQPAADEVLAMAPSRITVETPGLMRIVIETPSLFVLANPDGKAPAAVQAVTRTPSNQHAIALVACALAHLRKQYGDFAVRAALAAEPSFLGSLLTEENIVADLRLPPSGPRLG